MVDFPWRGRFAAARPPLWILLVPMLVLAGCSSGVMNAQRDLEAMHARGDYAAAAKLLDDPRTIKDYEADRPNGKDMVLWELERGAVALAEDQPARSVELFNHAEERTRYNYEKDGGQILSTWVWNDTAPEYVAAAYEDQYVNVMKILAYLEMGQIEGKATAEARRFADKARYLRSVFGRFFKVYSDETERKYARDAGSARLDDPRLKRYAEASGDPEFIESPLGAYLSAVAFMKTPGEAEAQRGAGERLLDVVGQQGGLIGDVDARAFEDLPTKSPAASNTLVVAFSGRGPVKEKDEFGPIFLWYTSIHIVLPRLRVQPSEVTGAYLETSGGERHDLHLVEDMSRVAAENFERQMPEIYERTMLRVFAKAAAVGVATVATDEATRHNHNDAERAAAQLGVRALGFLYLWLSEDADTRGWTMLPGKAWVGDFKLAPGEQNVRVVYTTAGGGTIAQAWRDVVAPDGADGLATVVEHCPR
jgi:hypothetical protein